MIDKQVRKALARIGDRVLIEVGRAGDNFTHVAYVVGVAIGLRWVRDGGTVVGRVGATITVGIAGWKVCDSDGVALAARDA
jgi:hypothetical protein